MQTAPSCACRAIAANSVRGTRLSREYSVCMCMSRRTRSTLRPAACAMPPRSSTLRSVRGVGLAFGERLQPCGVLAKLADHRLTNGPVEDPSERTATDAVVEIDGQPRPGRD